MSSRWKRVSKETPCPICKGEDWCSITTDGAVAGCMRSEAGCFKMKDTRDGARVYLHRLADRPRVEQDCTPSARGDPSSQCADADTLHKVYGALLGHLKLSAAHRENLQKRGLPDEEIDRRGYRSLPVQGRARIASALREQYGKIVRSVPGIITREKEGRRYFTITGAAGLLIPCRDHEGRIVALKVRRDTAPDDTSNKYLYLSSKSHAGPGPGAPVHVPLGVSGPVETARITEGELKADIVQAQTGVSTLSIPGVSNWRRALVILKDLEAQTVRLAFDADALRKPHVARALVACAEAILEAGLTVELERWEEIDGKGLDDLLAAGKTPELLQGEYALAVIRELAPPSNTEGDSVELDRLQDVLDVGGAAALFSDRALMETLARLADRDPTAFAGVCASLEGRVKRRDLDRALRPLRSPPTLQIDGETPLYFVEDGCIQRNVMTREGPVPVALCNFSARIIEDVRHDDGADQTRHLILEGTLAHGQPLPRVTIPADAFPDMGWVVPRWGVEAIVFAGQGNKDHLRTAIQFLSRDVQQRVIYSHTGWRCIDDQWYYLHAGGAIGSAGICPEIEVSLPKALSAFCLPPPTIGADRVEAIQASLRLLRLGADHLTFPLLAAVYRAALGTCDFSLFLAGPTGCFKSEIAALVQQHYGQGMDARHLPGNWASTGNALEGIAFACKDALFVVDDFAPTGAQGDVQRLHREADRLLRGQGNSQGRQRMRPDGSLRPERPPRGLVLSTGEDVPRGQSLRARLLVLEVSPGDFGPASGNQVLTQCQQDAAAGKYALALSGFLRWIASRYETLRSQLKQEVEELRELAHVEGRHARTPGILADLAVGLKYFLEYACAAEALTEEEQRVLRKRGWAALNEAGAGQASHLAAAEPAHLFLEMLTSAIAAGCAHVAGPGGVEPAEPLIWGWRPEEFSHGDSSDTRYRPQGTRIGWLDEEEFYLEPKAAYAAVQKFLRDQNEAFPITEKTLRRRLKEKGMLASTDSARNKLTIRKTLQGVRRDVLHIKRECVHPKTINPDEGPQEESCGPETRASNASLKGHRPNNGTTITTNRTMACEGMGRMGPSPTEERTTDEERIPVTHAVNGWGEWR